MIINFPLLGNAGGGGIDSAATQAMIDASLEGYYTSGETETAIDNKLGNYLSKSEYVPKELAISAALNQLNTDVQTISGNTPDMSLYTPTSGFSTINGSAITEGTNIVIEGGGSGTELLPVSEFPQSAETGTLIAKTDINPTLGYWELSEGVLTFHLVDTDFTGTTIIGRLYNNATEPMLPGDIIITLDWIAAQRLDYVISVENADNPDDYITRIPYDARGSINYEFDTIGEDPESSDPIVVTYDFLADTNLVITKTNRNYDTPIAIVSTDYSLANLPGTAVVDGIYQYDGTNWNKYEGGSASGSNIIELTQAEYDALTTKDPDTLYIISDADSINMDNYALQADLTALSGSVSTSLAGKADAANVTANASLCLFPTWNAQGVITGTYRQANDKIMKINGSSFRFYSSEGWNTPPIYAPTEAGDAGKPLIANGTNAAPVYAPYKFAFLTETEYDALTTKETDTIYFVVPDPE